MEKPCNAFPSVYIVSFKDTKMIIWKNSTTPFQVFTQFPLKTLKCLYGKTVQRLSKCLHSSSQDTHLKCPASYRVRIYRITVTRSHFVFINKTARHLRQSSDKESSSFSTIPTRKSAKKILDCTLNFMWRDFDTKLLDVFF